MIVNVQGNELIKSLEKGAINFDESKFPDIFKEQVRAVEVTNYAYKEAQRQEEIANSKVNKALKSADDLIREANNAGQHTARERGFGIFKHTSKKDEINATKANLQELIDCGIHSAEAQKELVEVQAALAESQTMLLKVQKTQMAYQRQIAETTQFLFLLSAYNMGATQSILINLEAVLKGASKEKIGEMAKQQLLMAMDQIKNQENIMLRVRENKETIQQLDSDLDLIDRKLDAVEVSEHEQDKLIAQNAESIFTHAKKLEEIEADDDKQDELIAKNAESIFTHAKKLEEIEADDDKQDELIAKNAENIFTHAKKLEEIEADDNKQDELIAKNAESIFTHAKMLEEMEADDDKQDELIELNKKSILLINDALAEQKNEIKSLEERIILLEENAHKKGWRIIVSILAVGALVLEVLQLVSII